MDSDPGAEKEIEQVSGNGETVSFDNFMKLELRVGLITGVDGIEGADKLYRLTVDIGEESPREMVAGLKPWHTVEELTGRRAVVVCNLEPAVIRGIRSNGMILASEGEGGVLLVEPGPDARPGDRIR